MSWLLIKHWRNPVVWTCAVTCLFSGPKAFADAYYDQGVKLYNQRNFKGAAPYFDTAVRNTPSDSNAFYYAALTYQQLGDWPRAKQYYREVSKRFPGTEAAGLAEGVLRKYDPNFVSRSSSQGSSSGVSSYGGGGGSGRSADYASLPPEAKIYFQRVRNSQYVEAQVNGRPIQMIFDTGAESCVFGKNHLRELGVNVPTGDPAYMSQGVGSSGGVPTWQMAINLKVGGIERKNFIVSVQEAMPTDPLLGQTFYKDYEYTTDPGASTISFKKKGATGSLYGDTNAVPFKREGNELVVNVQVNGKTMPMYFDTGADTIAFSPAHLQQIGLSIPDDHTESVSVGIGGATATKNFNVDRMKLGPVDRTNVEISVVEHSAMPHPLLGQSFYKDWQFTIDNDRHVIRFLRR